MTNEQLADWRTRLVRPRDPDYFRALDEAARQAAVAPKKKPAAPARQAAPSKPRRAPTPAKPRQNYVRNTGTCAECGRTTRRSDETAQDRPGTVSYGGGGLCSACEKRKRTGGGKRVPARTVCKFCGCTLRPSTLRLADRPGTRVHGGHGACMTCRTRLVNAGNWPPVPGSSL